MDGKARWSCLHHGKDLPVMKQREGCSSHRYIPILLANFAQPVDMDGDAVVYQMADKQFVNGDRATNPAYLTSPEIHACKDKVMLTEPQALELRVQFKGQFV